MIVFYSCLFNILHNRGFFWVVELLTLEYIYLWIVF